MTDKPETTAEPLRVAIYQLGTMDPDQNADYEVLHDLIEYTERACADLDAARERIAELEDAGAKVCEGFDRAVFVRNTAADHEPGWAIKAFSYLRALAALVPEEKR